MEVKSTTVLLDRDRTLRFDYDALDRLSDLPLARRGGRSPLGLWGDANGMDLNAMAIMLWAGARHEDPEITIDKMHAALKQTLRLRRTTFQAINEALNAAINQSECLGLFKPDEDGAGADAGNAPRAERPS